MTVIGRKAETQRCTGPPFFTGLLLHLHFSTGTGWLKSFIRQMHNRNYEIVRIYRNPYFSIVFIQRHKWAASGSWDAEALYIGQTVWQVCARRDGSRQCNPNISSRDINATGIMLNANPRCPPITFNSVHLQRRTSVSMKMVARHVTSNRCLQVILLEVFVVCNSEESKRS